MGRSELSEPDSPRSSPWLVQTALELCRSRAECAVAIAGEGDLWKPLKGHHSRQSPNSRTTDSTRALTRHAVKPG